MVKLDEFIQKANNVISSIGMPELSKSFSHKGRIPVMKKEWLSDGVDCEILQPGKQFWCKGKMRLKLVLEFCPNEPKLSETHTSKNLNNSDGNSSLDDIRATINN
jgi:hypothetical protein